MTRTDSAATVVAHAADGSAEMFMMHLRYRRGTPIVADGTHPVVIDDPSTVWVVYSGQVNVFVVRVKEGRPDGPRQFLFELHSGQAAFGIDPRCLASHAVGFILVGRPGTELLKLTLDDVTATPAQSNLADEWVRALNNWVYELSRLVQPQTKPRLVQELKAGESVALSRDAVVMPRDQMVWVQVHAGDVRWNESAPLTLETWIPVAPTNWLSSASEASTVHVEVAQTFATASALAQRLMPFHQLVAGPLQDEYAARWDADLSLVRERLQADKANINQALSDMMAATRNTTGTTATNTAKAELSKGAALLQAFTVAGAHLGLKINKISKARLEQADAVHEIARASHIRVRKVQLTDAWWQTDCGPLIGFWADTRMAVSIMPAGKGQQGYMLFDPVQQAWRKLNSDVASKLSPTAYMLYATFAHAAVTPGVILRRLSARLPHDLPAVLLPALLIGGLTLVVPLATRLIVDWVLPGLRVDVLVLLVGCLVFGAVATLLLGLAQNLALLRFEGLFTELLQPAVVDRLLRLQVSFFRKYSSGELAYKVMGINTIRQVLSESVSAALLSGLFSILNFGLLLTFQPTLWLTALGLIGVNALFIGAFVVVQLRYQRRLWTLSAAISGRTLQIIRGMSKLRVAGAEPRVFAQWAKGYSRQRRLRHRARFSTSILIAFSTTYPLISLLVVFAVVYSVGNLRISAGEFLAFQATLMQINVTLMQITESLVAMLSMVPLYESVKPILQAPLEVTGTSEEAGVLDGAIECAGIRFRYAEDGPYVLTDVSFSIRPGEMVAFVGPSGCGKSTLLRLLIGFEKPDAGNIFYSGRELSKLDVQDVRRQMGVVLQHSTLIAGDIFANIAGGRVTTLDEAWTAAQAASIDTDIAAMPMGMNTVLSDGGSALSGGQRQRLLIARAILERPRILLFDEATSALDNEAQAVVTRSLTNLNASRVVIAHRLSTIMNADRIYVMNEGRIVQSGKFADLVQQDGLFKELVQRHL